MNWRAAGWATFIVVVASMLMWEFIWLGFHYPRVAITLLFISILSAIWVAIYRTLGGR